MIEEKDIIFILGNTGSGKSTLILKILGYTLIPSKYKGLSTLVPIEKVEKDH
jgi:ABC-type lipoprotein export system ATPase subunit